jgi:Outer membrane protein beta-barrel domain
MTKFLRLFSFFFLVSATIINAQFKIGLSGGVNFASYTLSDKASNVDLTHKPGISIGAMAEYELTEKLASRISIGYVQSGGENEIILSGVNLQNKLFYNYLELSPYLTYKFIDANILAKIIGGLSFGYLLNAKVESKGTEANIKDDFNSFNLSGDLGLETEIPLMEKTSLLINGLYSYGLTNISKNVDSMETRDILINVGFLYEL